MQLKFKAITETRKTYEGTAEAEDRYALAHRLQQEGETLVSVEEIKEKEGAAGIISNLKNIEFFGGVKLREKIIFSRNLAAMISAGLSVTRALSVMERQTRNKAFKKVLSQVCASVQTGTALSAAFGGFPKVFPPLFVSMVKAGEEGGHVADSLLALASQMEKSYELHRKIRGAMIYPAIVVTAMVIVGIVLLVFVVPTLTETFVELEVELPRSTQAIIATSNFFRDNTIVGLSLLVLIVGLIVFAVRRPKGKRMFEAAMLHLPVIGALVRETNSARTARTFSSLLSSGVEVVAAVSITKDVVQNSFYKEVLEQAEAEIQKGKEIGEIFLQHEDLYPPLVGEMISVGEESGSLPEMLKRVAEFYEGEVSQKTKDLSTIIEPLLMIVIGVVVGFFAVSMISPIYSLSSAI